ncbi:MAG: luciferase family protein [Frankiales bacterium]|nr:luciferase family protein [Frankiales bacterium]
MSQRWGLTVPVTGVNLAEHSELIRALPDWGYTDAWSSEVAGSDAFTPLALAAAWEPRLRLGTAIVPAFTRGPALIAQSAATLAGLAPGRFSLGIGASSPVIVEDWNGLSFSEPFLRCRDLLRFLRPALAGEKVSGAFDTFAVKGFRLENAPAEPVQLLLAALRPKMLELAGREADGAILNWLSATDVRRCVAAVNRPSSHIVARIFVCPTENVDYARGLARRMIATYLTVEAYAQFHRWLGRGDALADLWRRWAAGDRSGAAAAVPDEVVDDLVLHGTPAECRRKVAVYVEAGVDVPVLAVLPTPDVTDAESLARVLAALGPGSGPREQEATRYENR